MRDVAGANNRAGGYASGGRVGSPPDRSGNMLDRALGYKTVDDRIAARNNVMARRQGGVTVPNVPNASPGQMVGAVLGGIPGFTSAPKIVKEIHGSFQPGYKPGLGIAQGIVDKIGGWTPGGIEGTKQVGRLNDQGDPGLNRQDALAQPQMNPNAPPPAPQGMAAFGPQPTGQNYLNGLPSHSVPQNYASLFPNSLSERDKQLLYARALK